MQAPMAVSVLLLAASVLLAPREVLALKTSKDRPVTKVVRLLEKMKSTLEKEAEEEAELMEKFNCWCKENSEEKTRSIEKDRAHVTEMRSRIEELTATNARLKQEYTNLAEDVAKSERSLDEQIALRSSQVDEFNKEKLDLSTSLDSVQHARTRLSQPGLLQVRDKEALGTMVKDMISRHAEKFNEDELQDMSGFMQQEPTSGSVDGTLQGLENRFTSSLKDLQAEEDGNKATFEKLFETKRVEISTGREQISSKKEQKTAADEEKAHLKQDVKDTEASIADDMAFASEVKEKCSAKAEAWSQRQKTRAEETEAVEKAIQVLDADDAHAVFSNTMNPSFLQLASEEEHARCKRAAEILSKAGRKLDKRLVVLAVQAKLDDFSRVKEKIDIMISALKKEQADEVDKKGYCSSELQENRLAIQAKSRAVEGFSAKKEVLTSKLGDATEQVQALQEEIKDLQKQQKLASQNREKENVAFIQVVQEQRQTQALLDKASMVLGEFYNRDEEDESFVQTQEIPQEPKTFAPYKTSSSSNGVMLMLRQLAADAKELERESVAAERESQADYETFVKDISASIKSKSKALNDRADDKAQAEGTLVETKESEKDADAQIEQLENTKLQLHDTCNFLMQNFDARQKARVDEIEALKEAKSFLSGAKL
eukprot:TRINITY_DN27578_c0_g1_i1.p1 TRINITY_DN27578_c0_g1~~TRINITY_DN27578_c0_g1_i1.p1  ORF type:complete len:707 (-),score=212.70 TRINITY_DN27578_c0_g1_i1:92-2062(-)